MCNLIRNIRLKAKAASYFTNQKISNDVSAAAQQHKEVGWDWSGGGEGESNAKLGNWEPAKQVRDHPNLLMKISLQPNYRVWELNPKTVRIVTRTLSTISSESINRSMRLTLLTYQVQQSQACLLESWRIQKPHLSIVLVLWSFSPLSPASTNYMISSSILRRPTMLASQ